MKVSGPEFERLVEKALARVPREFRKALVNVSIEVRDKPGREAAGMGPDLVGLYSGPVHAQHNNPTDAPLQPGRVFLYKENLEGIARTHEELQEEVSKTLRHELAHYFGISDKRLREVWPEGA